MFHIDCCRRHRKGAGVTTALASFVAMLALAPSVWASGSLVISQVYGGGGLGTMWDYKSDFIEIFNPTATSISVDGWSVQYANATVGTWAVTILSGSVGPGHYYLIKEFSVTSTFLLDLPTPDATGTIALSTGTGKVALVNGTAPLSGCPVSGGAPSSPVVDFVGYGPGGATPNCFEGSGPIGGLSSIRSVSRNCLGRTDTDDNHADFTSGFVNPHNTASPTIPVDFAPKTDFATGDTPYSMAMGDLNADGRPDLAVANGLDHTVSVLLGTADGSFGARSDYETGTDPLSVAIADLNADGKLDVVVGDQDIFAPVSVLLGNGDGTLGARSAYVTGTSDVSSVVVGDLNGDGRPDLTVAGTFSQVASVLLGNGDGTFGSNMDFMIEGSGLANSLALADLNSDTHLDLLVANGFVSSMVSVLLGNGDGTFGPITDFVTGTRPDNSNYPISVAAADLDADSKLDLVVVDTQCWSISVLLGNGDGTFRPKTDYPTWAYPYCVTIGDLNSDGRPDLAVSIRGDAKVSVFLGNGNGTFGLKMDFVTGDSPLVVGIANLNGDARPDLVVMNQDNSTVSVLLGTAVSTCLAASETHVNVSTSGGSNGSIDVTVFGGTPPYGYSWSNGATTQDVSGLAAGDYMLTVTDAAGITTNLAVTITQPASPIADLGAEQAAPPSDVDGTVGIRLHWTPLAGPYTYEVYRAAYGNYPEYDTAPAGVPTPPPTYPPASQWVPTLVTNPGETDDVAVRDFYYYVLYVKDGPSVHSTVSNMTTGTLNYLLGDVSADCAGDNRVNTQDISFLGAHYGITLADPDPLGCLDVGPTTNATVNGRPIPDDRIDFEDLILFAINYGTVPHAALRASVTDGAAGNDELSVLAPYEVRAGETIVAALQFKGAMDVQGLSAQLAWNHAVVEPVSVASGDLLARQNGVALSSAPGRVDAVLLGQRELGLAGNGVLATVTFRAIASGDPEIVLATTKARNAANRPVALGTRGERAVPRLTELMAAVPNPFRDGSVLEFSLAKAGPVQLAIYSVDGRKVRVLANDTRAAGTYRLAWDGRDDRGNAARAGVFFARLTTADGHLSRMVLRIQ